MTERLYYSDSYRLSFDATVVRSDENDQVHHTVLDRTAFYPTSGGQLHDTGHLGAAPIIDVIDLNGEIVHVSTNPVGQPGDLVEGKIDEARRRRFRQMHTAQHLLSQMVERHCGLPTLSVHLGESYGAIELPGNSIDELSLAAAFDASNLAIAQNTVVSTRFLTPDEAAALPLRKGPSNHDQIRVIQIGEIDYSACGGTHCRSTAEIGLIAHLDTRPQRGNSLVRWLAGDMARDDYWQRLSITRELANELSTSVDHLLSVVSQRLEEATQLRRDKSRLLSELMSSRVTDVVEHRRESASGTWVATEAGDFSGKLTSAFASTIAEAIGGIALVYDGTRVTVASRHDSLSAQGLITELCARSAWRGGGSDSLGNIGPVKPGSWPEFQAIVAELLAGGAS